MKRETILLVIALLLWPLAISGEGERKATLSGEETVPSQERLRFVVVYDEANSKYPRIWLPGGWMPEGAADAITFNDAHSQAPHSGKTCIEFSYLTIKTSWVGIYWLAHDQWGESPAPDLFELLGIRKGDQVALAFWARGDAQAEFKVGGVSRGKFPDSIRFPVSTGYVSLTKDWKKYTIDLTGMDLTNVIGSFCCVINRPHNPTKDVVSVYLDDIRFEAKVP